MLEIKIVKNAVFCKNCKEEIESKHRHDYVVCSCGQIAVDGGKDYLRRNFFDVPGMISPGWENRTIVIEEEIVEPQ